MAKTERGHMDIIAVDPLTGVATTVVGEVDVIVHQATNGRGRKKSQIDRRHGMWGLIDFDRMAQLHVTPSEWRVLTTIANNIQIEDNIARIGPTEIAKTVGMHAQVVQRALASLRDRRIILAEGRIRWRVSPWLIYRGSVTDWEEITSLYPEPQLERVG